MSSFSIELVDLSPQLKRCRVRLHNILPSLEAPSQSNLMPHELLHTVRTLALRHIRLLALRPVQFRLRRVERIEPGAQRVFQRAHVAARVQDFPGVRAFARLARLEHDEQSV